MDNRGRILLADDEETFLQSTADLLRDEGYVCDCANDAAQANILLQQTDYDLLISDINMPGNVQLEFLSTIHQQGSSLPVIVITGYPSVQTAVHSFRLSAIDYLQKPINIEELIDLIEKALRKGAFFQNIRKTREEMKSLISTLENLEEVGQQPGSGTTDSQGAFAVSAYLDQVVGHLATVSTGLKTTLDKIKNGNRDEPKEVLAEEICPQCHAYREMLYETIQALTKTKEAFKSKTLGELRRRVEILLKSH